MLTLGTAIRRLRTAAGFSQSKLAERLDVQASYISHLEAGRREPSLDLIRRMAEVLELPPGFFMAMVLWADLPADQRETYRPVVEGLLGMAVGDTESIEA